MEPSCGVSFPRFPVNEKRSKMFVLSERPHYHMSSLKNPFSPLSNSTTAAAIHLSKTRFHLSKTRFHLSETRFHLSETRIHLSETRIHLSKTPFHLSKTPFHLSKTPFHLSETRFPVSEKRSKMFVLKESPHYGNPKGGTGYLRGETETGAGVCNGWNAVSLQ